MEVIHRAVGEAASRRTMQRRLEELVRLGWILRHGQGRGTRYQLTAAGQQMLRPEPRAGLRQSCVKKRMSRR